MSNEFDEQAMREELLLHLVRDKMKKSLTLESLVNNPDEVKQHFSDLNLIELLALQKSAKNNIEDAKLFAVYLFEQLNGSQDLSDIVPTKEDGVIIEKAISDLKNNLSEFYQDTLGDINEKANDADAAYLLAKAQLESKKTDVKIKGLKNMKILVNQQEFPDLAEKAQSVINNINAKMQLEKNFCTKLLKILNQLKNNNVSIKEFSTISDVYTANRAGNELNYHGIMNGLANLFKNLSISKLAEMNLDKSPMTQKLYAAVNDALNNINKDGYALKKLTDVQSELASQSSVSWQRTSPSPRKE